MIRVFHGENIAASRKAILDEIKQLEKSGYETIKVEGKDLTPPKLIQILESPSLFKRKRALVIENFFSLKKSKEGEKLIKLLKDNKDCEILIWEGKELARNFVQENKNFSFTQFKFALSLFNFLDELRPNQPEKNLKNFHYCLSFEDPQMIFTMLARQIRFLILASNGGDILDNLPSWQKKKFSSQAKLFKINQLIKIYQKLLRIDYQQKTSQTPFDLISSLDLLISEI